MTSEIDNTVLQLMSAAEHLCNINTVDIPKPSNESGLYCEALWDGWGCWNYTLAGHNASADCPGFVDGFDVNRKASRFCTEMGEWWRAPNNKSWANYTTCVDLSSIQEGKQVIQIFIAGYSISSIFLAVALFIFFYFKQLQCPRVTLHKNLFTSYILNSIVWILYYTLAAENPNVLAKNPVWCVIIHVITQYFVTCNFFWMFCEGLYLHTLIVIAFTTGKKLLIGCFIVGWGFPIIPTTIYTIVRSLSDKESTRCWIDPSTLTWVIFGPIVATLIINAIFICNIIRVLITKIRAVNSPSSSNHRRSSSVEPKLKAVRAALILIPLLGIQFILFPLEPPAGTKLHHIYSMASAFVVSFQGFFVAMIFCFFNGEVNVILRRRWGQHRLMRSGSVVSKHRDSMFFNQTQATVMERDPDSTSSGCLKSNSKRNSITKKLNPFKHRSKSCDSATNGLMNHRGDVVAMGNGGVTTVGNNDSTAPYIVSVGINEGNNDSDNRLLLTSTRVSNNGRNDAPPKYSDIMELDINSDGIDVFLDNNTSKEQTTVTMDSDTVAAAASSNKKSSRANSDSGVTRTVTFGEISKI